MKKAVFLFALLLISLPCRAGTPVTINPSVELSKGAIRLSDVFSGIPLDADKDVALSPMPGKSVTYDARVLAKLAQANDLDWQPASLTDKVVLTRGATKITADMIEKSVREKLSSSESLKNKTIEVVFDNKGLVINLPSDKTPDYTVANFAYDEAGRRFRGEIIADLGAGKDYLPISGRVNVKKTVPVLARPLSSGTVVGAADLDWVTVNEEQIAADILTDGQNVIGQELRHDQGSGDYLRARDVIPPRLVTRGSLVAIKVETPVMIITAQGRALQDGGKGDVVRVTNTQSNRVVEGTVESTGVVRVGTLQKMAEALSPAQTGTQQ